MQPRIGQVWYDNSTRRFIVYCAAELHWVDDSGNSGYLRKIENESILQDR